MAMSQSEMAGQQSSSSVDIPAAEYTESCVQNGSTAGGEQAVGGPVCQQNQSSSLADSPGVNEMPQNQYKRKRRATEAFLPHERFQAPISETDHDQAELSIRKAPFWFKVVVFSAALSIFVLPPIIMRFDWLKGSTSEFSTYSNHLFQPPSALCSGAAFEVNDPHATLFVSALPSPPVASVFNKVPPYQAQASIPASSFVAWKSPLNRGSTLQWSWINPPGSVFVAIAFRGSRNFEAWTGDSTVPLSELSVEYQNSANNEGTMAFEATSTDDYFLVISNMAFDPIDVQCTFGFTLALYDTSSAYDTCHGKKCEFDVRFGSSTSFVVSVNSTLPPSQLNSDGKYALPLYNMKYRPIARAWFYICLFGVLPLFALGVTVCIVRHREKQRKEAQLGLKPMEYMRVYHRRQSISQNPTPSKVPKPYDANATGAEPLLDQGS